MAAITKGEQIIELAKALQADKDMLLDDNANLENQLNRVIDEKNQAIHELNGARSEKAAVEAQLRDKTHMLDELRDTYHRMFETNQRLRQERDAQKQVTASAHVELRGKLRRQRWELRRLNRQVNSNIAARKAAQAERAELVRFFNSIATPIIPVEEMEDGTHGAHSKSN